MKKPNRDIGCLGWCFLIIDIPIILLWLIHLVSKSGAASIWLILGAAFVLASLVIVYINRNETIEE